MFTYGRMDSGAKTSEGMIFDLVLIELILLIYSLIRDVTSLQRALVMMQVSGQNLLVFVIGLMCIFFFEVQSESSANMFHLSGYFWTVGLGVYAHAKL